MLETELERYDPGLLEKPRWLVVTKLDQRADDERDEAVSALVERLDWTAPAFGISSLSRDGLNALTSAMARHLLDGGGDDAEP